MKQAAMVLCLLMLATSGSAQETNTRKIREYYLTVNSFDRLSFSLKYKKQLNQNKFFKIGLVDLSGFAQSSKPNPGQQFPTYTTQFSAGFQAGLEKRRILNDRFAIFYGPNIYASFRHHQMKFSDPSLSASEQMHTNWQQSFGLSYTLGGLLNVTDRILFAAEINPGASYTLMYSKAPYNQGHQMGYVSAGLSNNFAQLSIAYRP